MKEIFEIYFETSQSDPEYISFCLKYASTEKEVYQTIIPQIEKEYDIHSDRGQLYERKVSYCKLNYVKEWGKDNSFKIKLVDEGVING